MARRSSLVSSISLSCLFATIRLAAEPPDGTVRWRSTQAVDAGGINGDYAWAAAADDRGRLVAIGDAATATVKRKVEMCLTPTGAPDPEFGGPTGLVVNPFGRAEFRPLLVRTGQRNRLHPLHSTVKCLICNDLGAFESTD